MFPTRFKGMKPRSSFIVLSVPSWGTKHFCVVGAVYTPPPAGSLTYLAPKGKFSFGFRPRLPQKKRSLPNHPFSMVIYSLLDLGSVSLVKFRMHSHTNHTYLLRYMTMNHKNVWLGYVNYVVVSNIFYFHPYLGKIPILTI